jgi:hypothetical protein
MASPGLASAQDAASAPKAPAYNKVIGEVVSVDADGRKMSVKPDSGAAVDVVLDEKTSFMLVPPGEKDLHKATRIELKDIGPGDRVYARSRVMEGQTQAPAVSVIVMSKTQVAQHQESTREEWQKRGAAGRVTAIDPAAGTITISVQAAGGPKPLVINTDAKTGFRRYAPDSVKFADAKPSKLDEIAVGNNLRVLGDRSEDGATLHAEEIVSGSFRNIAGTIASIDAVNNEIKITDLVTKKPMIIKVNGDTNLRKLPPQMAMILARMSGNAPAAPGAAGAPGSSPAGGAAAGGASGQAGQGAGAWQGRSGGGNSPQAGGGSNQWSGGAGGGAGGGNWAGGGAGGGRMDFNRMVERAPQIALADLKPGDALVIASTSGTDASRATAITIVAGVEPMFAAAPPSGRGQGGVGGGMWSLDVALPE